ncbi:oligosaccharide flippase family protein [bacterium]|nr:oligosaccharide flippase family protein [bacterium]
MSIGRNVLKLLSSRVATQILSFVTAPIIARLYSPDDFGIRQIFMSIAGVIAVVIGNSVPGLFAGYFGGIM